MSRSIQILDLDGCVADDRWRRGFIRDVGMYLPPDEMNRFHRYHSLCFLDKFANKEEITQPDIIVLTGRPLLVKELTMRWLRAHQIVPLHIIFRNNDDNISTSVTLKRRMLAGLLDPNSYDIRPEEITLAIDDRDDVVAMYKNDFGIFAKVVRIGDEEHSNG